MKRRTILVTVMIAILSLGVMGVSGLMGVTGASADDIDDQQDFRWLAASGVVDFPAPGVTVCDLGVPCPDVATAANGDTIEIAGEGTLSVDEDGEPKDVDGGGSFNHNLAVGGSASGTWEAKQLLMFDSYGPGAAFLPEAWNSGRALILVHLEYDDGLKADAILEIGCRLPGSPGIPGTIEGIRLLISGGQNFNAPTDPSSTLFIDITDQDDD